MPSASSIPSFEFSGNKGKFLVDCIDISTVKKHKFVQETNHALFLDTNEMLDHRINYTHENPVRALIVFNTKDYFFSPIRDYAIEEGFVNLQIEKLFHTNKIIANPHLSRKKKILRRIGFPKPNEAPNIFYSLFSLRLRFVESKPDNGWFVPRYFRRSRNRRNLFVLGF